MSYSLVPYVVDLDELRRAVGSKDEALLAAVAEADGESAEEEEAEEGEVTSRQALRQLVMGETPDPESAHQYGYALEQLCAHLGERLDREDAWSGIHWEVLEATGMEEVVTRTGSPVPLPPIDSFPAIGHLTADQVAATVAKMGDGHLKSAAPSGRKARRSFQSWLLGLVMRRITQRDTMSDEDTRELLDAYEEWLREAAEKRQGLVFFYY